MEADIHMLTVPPITVVTGCFTHSSPAFFAPAWVMRVDDAQGSSLKASPDLLLLSAKIAQ
jgi:hypothetical protein